MILDGYRRGMAWNDVIRSLATSEKTVRSVGCPPAATRGRLGSTTRLATSERSRRSSKGSCAWAEARASFLACADLVTPQLWRVPLDHSDAGGKAGESQDILMISHVREADRSGVKSDRIRKKRGSGIQLGQFEGCCPSCW